MSTLKRKHGQRAMALNSTVWPLFVGQGVLLAGGIATTVYLLRELRGYAQKSAQTSGQIESLQQQTQGLANRIDALAQQLDAALQTPKSARRATRAETAAAAVKPAPVRKRTKKAATPASGKDKAE